MPLPTAPGRGVRTKKPLKVLWSRVKQLRHPLDTARNLVRPDDELERAARNRHRELRAWGLLPWWLVPPWRKLKIRVAEEVEDFKVEGQSSAQRSARYCLERETGVSLLPVLRESAREQGSQASATDPMRTKSEDEIRTVLYAEAMHAWRQLTDVRFRLMAMLPALSIVAFVPLVLLAASADSRAIIAGILLALLGLCVTHGLHIYEQRNDGLYNNLISRARRIEAELGVATGVMLGRPSQPHRRVSHGRATRWVFGSVKLAWIVVVAMLVSTLVAEATGGSDGMITTSEYEMIVLGMDRSEMAMIVGGFGDVERTSDTVLTVRYAGDGIPDVYVRFENGVVAGLSQRDASG